jgi:Icc-related predicted phosphoesterase
MKNMRLKNYLLLGLAIGILHSYTFSQKVQPFRGDLQQRGERNCILFVGDTQRTGYLERLLLREQNDQARQAVMEKMVHEDPACVVILGDLVASGGDQDAWSYFDQLTINLRRDSIPVFAVPGNHEYFDGRETGLANFFERFPHPGNRTWYSFRLKNLAVILLNSNFDELRQDEFDLQNKWYLNTLDEYQKDSTVASIIVSCHHPPFTNSTIVSASKSVREYFVKPFEETQKAKIFFTGHCHSYERFFDGGKTFIVTGGGGGPRQEVQTRPKKQRYHDYFAGPAIRPFHFCRLIIQEKDLMIQMVCMDEKTGRWSVGDEVKID